MKDDTIITHSGRHPFEHHGAVNPPVYHASTILFPTMQEYLDRGDTANIMLGMALFNQKLLEQSRKAFEAAQGDNRSRRAATQWIAYVDSEIKRRDLLLQDAPEYQQRERDELLDALPQGSGSE